MTEERKEEISYNGTIYAPFWTEIYIDWTKLKIENVEQYF